MADAAEIAEDATPAKPRRKLELIVEVVGALALGGGGFSSVYAGLFDPSASPSSVVAAGMATPRRWPRTRRRCESVLGDVAFGRWTGS